MCRDFGTFRNYLSHLVAGCEILSLPTEWCTSGQVRRAKEGLKRLALVQKGPSLAVTKEVIIPIAAVSVWCQVRFFCILAWVFLLRAQAEGSGLVFLNGDRRLVDVRLDLPVGAPGVIGIYNEAHVVRLSSRKNALSG